MNLVKVETEVTKEVHEIGLAVKKVIGAYKVAMLDGFQVGQDVPAILMASYAELTKAIAGVDEVSGELKEAPLRAAMGALIPLAEGVELLMDKSEGEA